MIRSYLYVLQREKIFDHKYIKEQIKKTKHFFEKNTYSLKYMEGAEIYQMDDIPLEILIKEIYEQIKFIDKTIDISYNRVDSINKDIDQLESKKNEKSKKSWFRAQKYILDEKEIKLIKKLIIE